MGYCADGDDKLDVFLSYSRADNTAHIGWVEDFERYLKEQVPAVIVRSTSAEQDRAHLFRVCRDETGFPPSGDLAEIVDEKVRSAQFLFIFLGSGYLSSEWCLYELEKFREYTGVDLGETLKRLYLIVLDREALVALQEDRGRAASLPKRRVVWKQLQGVSSRAMRIQDFLQNDDLVPVYGSDGRVDHRFHQVGQRIVRDLVKKLGERRALLKPAPRPLLADEPRTVVIGAVPERLRKARDELVRSLGDAPVTIIQEADLVDKDQLASLIQGAACFVQPFDRAPTIGGEIVAGGHLKVQSEQFEQLLDRGRVASDATMIWWLPPSVGDQSGLTLQHWDKALLDEIDALPDSRRRTCSAKELGRQVLDRGQMEVVTADVWLEWTKSDELRIREAKDIVRERFNAHCRRHASGGAGVVPALKFLTADWNNLRNKFSRRTESEKPDGVVIVFDDEKDLNALEAQSDRISSLDNVLHHKMLPSIFYMRQEEGFYEPDDWCFVRFVRSDSHLSYDPDQLEDFVARLYDILLKKYPSLLQGERA